MDAAHKKNEKKGVGFPGMEVDQNAEVWFGAVTPFTDTLNSSPASYCLSSRCLASRRFPPFCSGVKAAKDARGTDHSLSPWLRVGGEKGGAGPVRCERGRETRRRDDREKEEKEKKKRKARLENLINSVAVSWWYPPTRARRIDPGPPTCLPV